MLKEQYLAGFFDAVGKVQCLPHYGVSISSWHRPLLIWMKESYQSGTVSDNEDGTYTWAIVGQRGVEQFLERVMPHLIAKYDVVRMVLKAIRGEVNVICADTLLQTLESQPQLKTSPEPSPDPLALLAPSKAETTVKALPSHREGRRKSVRQYAKRRSEAIERIRQIVAGLKMELDTQESTYHHWIKEKGSTIEIFQQRRQIPLRHALEIRTLLKMGFKIPTISHVYPYTESQLYSLQYRRSWKELDQLEEDLKKAEAS